MILTNSNEAIELFISKEKLEAAAIEISNNADESLRQATYLYFLARFLVIYYEVNFAELPVQVWNEYRNALDHYFRSVTEKEDAEVIKHRNKMEGHLQRAVLDICKIICHKTEGRFAETLESEVLQALKLVDNGDFYPKLCDMFGSAKNAFIEAKAWDLRLGDGAHNDRGIVGKYLDAFYSYRGAEDFLHQNRSNIQKAEINYKAIQHQSTTHHLRDSLLAKAIWYGGSAVLIFISGKYWGELHHFYDSFISKVQGWFS